MISFIHSILRKEQICYVFKEYSAKLHLGWYYVCFLHEDSTVRTFSCWFNTTSVGASPMSLQSVETDLNDICLEDIGVCQTYSSYKEVRQKLLTQEMIGSIETELEELITEHIKVTLPDGLSCKITTMIRFDPVLSLLFKIQEGKKLIGHIIRIGDILIPVGFCTEQIQTYTEILRGILNVDAGFYKLCEGTAKS